MFRKDGDPNVLGPGHGDSDVLRIRQGSMVGDVYRHVLVESCQTTAIRREQLSFQPMSTTFCDTRENWCLSRLDWHVDVFNPASTDSKDCTIATESLDLERHAIMIKL